MIAIDGRNLNIRVPSSNIKQIIPSVASQHYFFLIGKREVGYKVQNLQCGYTVPMPSPLHFQQQL